MRFCCWAAWVAAADTEDDGFQRLFNGRDLEGWDGNPRLWRVEEGAITGQTTPDNPTQGNTFLIWRGGDVADFELHLQFRIEGGNSGVQYRSQEAAKWVLGGYQADIDAAGTFTGILYEERGRGILAQRGQRVEIDTEGNLRQAGTTAPDKEIRDSINKEGWNQYVIVAKGNHLVQTLNGKVTVDVTDNQAARAACRACWVCSCTPARP